MKMMMLNGRLGLKVKRKQSTSSVSLVSDDTDSSDDEDDDKASTRDSSCQQECQGDSLLFRF